MTPEQIKAGKKLKAALRSCGKVNLSVRALTDVGFYVVPRECFGVDYTEDTDPHTFYPEFGMDCDPGSVHWDGGAGV